MSKYLWIILFFLVPIMVNAQDKERRPWYIGFGIGTGFGAAWEVGGGEVTFDDWSEGMSNVGPKISLNFKVGGTLSPELLLGGDITAIAQQSTDALGEGWAQITNIFGVLTYFPVRSGPFVRGGGGFSNLLLEIDSVVGLNVREQYTGFGFLVGAGYAFWLGRRFNLTLNIDHARQFYSGDPDSSRFTIIYLGFDWY